MLASRLIASGQFVVLERPDLTKVAGSRRSPGMPRWSGPTR